MTRPDTSIEGPQMMPGDPPTPYTPAIDPAIAPPHTLAATPPPAVDLAAVAAAAIASSGNARDPNAPNADKLFKNLKNPTAITAPTQKPTLNHLRIGQERRARGWTLEQCGKAINLGSNPGQLFHQYESGRVKRPKPLVAQAIADLFGLKLADIFIDPGQLIRRAPADTTPVLPTSAANVAAPAGINLQADTAMEDLTAAYTAGELAGYQRGYREGIAAATAAAGAGGV